MERRLFDIEVRLATDEGKPARIAGYAARYYDGTPETEYRFAVGRQKIVERIRPGAFDRAMNDDIVALFNHDPNYVLGRKSAGTMEVRVDGKGLAYDITPPASAAGIIEAIKRGDVKGASFSFTVRSGGQSWRDAEIDGQQMTIRELTDLQVYDVGPVTMPAYQGASSGIRSEDAASLERELAAWHESRAADLLNGPDARRRRAMRARLVEIGYCSQLGRSRD